MSSEARRVTGGHQKQLVKMFESLCGRYSRWDIWSDFIFFSAAAISNAVDKSFAEEREKEYLSRSSKYKPAEMQTFAKMFAEVVNGMEHEPDQDFLGELYMALGLGNDKNGQFFTPYGVCVAMSQLTGDFKQKVESEGWISVNDPACGAGATLIAFANECHRAGINYQTAVLFVGQDILRRKRANSKAGKQRLVYANVLQRYMAVACSGSSDGNYVPRYEITYQRGKQAAEAV